MIKHTLLIFFIAVNALFCEVNPIPAKAALNMIGYDMGTPRLPLIEMSDFGKDTLRNTLVDFGLLK